MGCDCAPKVAYLFLFWYEHDYISHGVEDKNPVVYTLTFASRYIDDLNTPNISPNIVDIICNDIYPHELDIVQTPLNCIINVGTSSLIMVTFPNLRLLDPRYQHFPLMGFCKRIV